MWCFCRLDRVDIFFIWDYDRFKFNENNEIDYNILGLWVVNLRINV